MGLRTVFQATLFVWALQLALAAQKLSGHLEIDWWLVLSPLWSPTALALVLGALILMSPWTPRLR